MNGLDAALAEISGHLEDQRVPYMVIGGYANLVWGRPRMTEDIDLTILLPEDRWPAFVEGLAKHFAALPKDPLAFMRETRVLPVRSAHGVRLDLVLGGLPYEELAVSRARAIEIGKRAVMVCAPEDLIVMKLVAGRPRDLEDVDGILVRQGDRLDLGHLERWIDQIASGLDRPELRDELRVALNRVKPTGERGKPDGRESGRG